MVPVPGFFGLHPICPHRMPARFSACMRSCFHILSPTVYPKKHLNIGHSRRMSFLSFHLSSALKCSHRSHRVLYACRQNDQVSSRDMSICIPLPLASCPEFSLLGIMSDVVTQQAYYQALGEGDRQKEVGLPDPVHQCDRRHQHLLDQ